MHGPVRALLLDADGTLWDTAAAMLTAGAAGALAAWPRLSPQQARSGSLRFRTDSLGAFSRYAAGHGSFEQMRTTRVRDVGAALGLGEVAGERERFEAAYEPSFRHALTAYPDAPRLLEAARAAGLAVRILTNSSAAYTAGKLAVTGLVGLAGAVCSRDCLGLGKPNPAVFRHACVELGVAPAEVLYVGDEWASDALGASEAGLAAVWLVRPGGDPALEVIATPQRRAAAKVRAIPLIASLDDVLPLLHAGPDSQFGGRVGDR